MVSHYLPKKVDKQYTDAQTFGFSSSQNPHTNFANTVHDSVIYTIYLETIKQNRVCIELVGNGTWIQWVSMNSCAVETLAERAELQRDRGACTLHVVLVWIAGLQVLEETPQQQIKCIMILVVGAVKTAVSCVKGFIH